MTDLSQTPSEVLERAKVRTELALKDSRLDMKTAARTGLSRQLAGALAAINAELSRRQKDESK